MANKAPKIDTYNLENTELNLKVLRLGSAAVVLLK